MPVRALVAGQAPRFIERALNGEASISGSYQIGFRAIGRSHRFLALEPFPFFNEQHKIGLHPHQQPCDARAINVGVNESLHFGTLQPNVPANPMMHEPGSLALCCTAWLAAGSLQATVPQLESCSNQNLPFTR
jgi:hypothetical protein